MSENKKNKKAESRQDWHLPKWLEVLRKIWMVLFTIFKVVAGAAVTVLMIVGICVFVFVGILGDYLQEDILPQSNVDMESYDHEQNSTLYYVDSDGQIQVYQVVYADTSSEWAYYDDIPEDLIHAAVAIEDHRFYEHQGVDWITTVKATARMFFGDSSVGGSSITQQLIKNILLKDDDSADDVTVQRKVMEIFRAIQLEKRYDKQTIMEMYLNCIYLGQNCEGVRAAAATYFGKELEKLTLAECASLISITNSPTYYDPYQNFENNKERKENVLWAMLDNGWITQQEYDEAIAQELVLKYGIDDEDRLAQCPNESCGYEDTVSTFTKNGERYYCPKCGTEVLVETNASQDNYTWYTDTVLEDVAKALAEQDNVSWNDSTKKLYMQQIQSAGYNIYTCLDMKVQTQLDAIYTDLSAIPATRGGQQLQSAMVIVDNRSGDIVAMVGGVGEKEGFDDWNRATDANLQSGSSIKPLAVYAPGFESGSITPATVIPDMPLDYDTTTEGAYPKNDTRTYSYSRTVFSGVVNSVNAVAANTLRRIGEGYSFSFAKDNFGLTTLVESYTNANGEIQSDIGVGPLALGAQTWGVTVRDMTDAFATFANDGVFREGRTFTKVYDSKGNVVLDNEQKTEQILSEKTVDYMNYCLVNAVQNGTSTGANAASLSGVGITAAGKTGTTGDSKDRWFCGYTGYYTAAVWCGFDSPEVIKMVNGGNPAAQLWKKVMEPLHKGKDDLSLYDNSKMTTVTVCLDSGKLATDACTNDVRVSMYSGFSRLSKAKVYPEDVPGESCDAHVAVDYCTVGGGVANEYCKHFAEAGADVTLTSKGLVKLTQDEINEILMAGKYNLNDYFLCDDYIYLVDGEGNDVAFHGLYNTINNGIEAPYKVCTVHTKAAWEAYQQQNPAQPTDPTEPGETEPGEDTSTSGATRSFDGIFGNG